MPKGVKGTRSNLCSKCKKVKQSELKRYCRECSTNYLRGWRNLDPLSPEQRLKANVRRKTGMRVKRGLLIKYPCEACNTMENLEAHHDDYYKPYDIRWLCRTHHKQHHRDLNESKRIK